MPGPHYKQTAVAIILIFFAIGLSAASVGAADSLTVVTHVRIGPRLDAGVDQLVFAGIATSPSVADAEIALVAVRTQDSWFGDHWDLRLRLPGHELTLASDSIDRKLIRPGQSYKAVLSVNRATGEVSAGLWNLDSGQELASGFWYAEELPDAEHVVSGAVSDTEGAVLQTVSAQAASGYERLGAPLALRGARAAIRRPGAAISHTILDWKATDAYLEIDGIDGRLPGSIVVDVIYPDGASRRHELEPGPRVTVPVPADQGPPGRYGAKISYHEPGYMRQLFDLSWRVVLPEVQVRFDIPEAFAFLKGDVSGPIEGSLKVTSSHALSDVSIVVTNGFGEELVRRTGLTLPAGLSEWPFVIGQGHEGTEGTSADGGSATMPGAGTAEDGDPAALLALRAELRCGCDLPEGLDLVRKWRPIMSEYVFSHDRSLSAGSTDGFVDVYVAIGDLAGYSDLVAATGYSEVVVVFTSPSGAVYRRRAIRNEAAEKWTARLWTDEAGIWTYRVELGIGTTFSTFEEQHFVVEEARAGERAAGHVAAIGYVANSSVKVNQLIGDFDPHLQTATLSRTLTRYGVKDADVAGAITSGGRIIFLFGDGIDGRNLRLPGLIAYAPNRDPEELSGLQLHFYADGPDKALVVAPPGLPAVCVERPTGGVRIGDRLYLVVKKDRRTLPDGNIAMGSVLIEFDESRGTFRTVRELSPVGGKFAEVNMRMAPGPILGLPDDGPYVLIWGTGKVYRQSPVYLAAVKASEIEQPGRMWYFAGLDAGGRPAWGTTEDDAVPLEPMPDDMGEFSVIWVDELQLWLMARDGASFYWARDPWGPWNEVADGSGIHTAPGVADGAHIVEAFTRVSGDVLTVYWVASTRNPNTVILVRSDFEITWAREQP